MNECFITILHNTFLQGPKNMINCHNMIHFEPFTGWPANWKGEVQGFSIEFSFFFQEEASKCKGFFFHWESAGQSCQSPLSNIFSPRKRLASNKYTVSQPSSAIWRRIFAFTYVLVRMDNKKVTSMKLAPNSFPGFPGLFL